MAKTPAKKQPVKKTSPTKTSAKKSVAKTARPATETATREPAVPAIVEGDKAPAFTLPRDGNGDVSLSDFKGRKLVLYFYPKADTPGCTQEAMDFSRLAKSFDKASTSILGVSADPVKALDRFRAKHGLGVALGSDESHAMLTAYGVWGEKSMYGKTYMGVTRATFLIGPDGRIAKVWPKVKVPGHADEVLKAAQSL